MDDDPRAASGVQVENVDDQATGENNINTEQLAEEVFSRLRWRLSIERDRTFG